MCFEDVLACAAIVGLVMIGCALWDLIKWIIRSRRAKVRAKIEAEIASRNERDKYEEDYVRTVITDAFHAELEKLKEES